MIKLLKLIGACISTVLLTLTLTNAHAALVSYTITGEVVLGDETWGPGSNAFGLSAGDFITAVGTFDDSVLTAGAGTIDFSSGSGNSMTIFVGTETFTAANDDGFVTGSGPTIELASLTTLVDFDFQAFLGTNGAAADFNSNFTSFDDFDLMFGDWTSVEITAVPVPAAVWLFGSGLLGLVGMARRKKA